MMRHPGILRWSREVCTTAGHGPYRPADGPAGSCPGIPVTSCRNGQSAREGHAGQEHGFVAGTDAYMMKTSIEKSRLPEIIHNLLEQRR